MTGIEDIGVSRSLMPYHSRFVDNGGFRQHFIDEGSGPPVVMVHGNPSWCFLWRDLIGGLRDGYRCLAVDHIGCGLSEKPGDGAYPFTLARRVEDLGRWIDGLDLKEPITLVAHDWGGMIAMAWAVQNPGRVGRIALFNTAAFPNPYVTRLPWQLWLVRNTPVGAWLVEYANAFAVGAAWTAVTRRRLPPEVREAFVAPYRRREDRLATLRFVQDIPLGPGDAGYDIVLGTERLLPVFSRTPVFVGWGLRDFVFDKRFLERFKAHWPHAEVMEFADSGHYVLEDRHEDLVPAVRRFLDTHPASPGTVEG
jgi:haloalkane dehalogenase